MISPGEFPTTAKRTNDSEPEAKDKAISQCCGRRNSRTHGVPRGLIGRRGAARCRAAPPGHARRNVITVNLAVIVAGLAVIVVDLAIIMAALAIIVAGLAIIVAGLAIIVAALAVIVTGLTIIVAGLAVIVAGLAVIMADLAIITVRLAGCHYTPCSGFYRLKPAGGLPLHSV